MGQMSERPRRQELSVLISSLSMADMLLLSWTSRCQGHLHACPCSLLTSHNLLLALFLTYCPKVMQEPPVTWNFFTALPSGEHFATLRCCGKGVVITNAPHLDPDFPRGPGSGTRYWPCGYPPLKDAPAYKTWT